MQRGEVLGLRWQDVDFEQRLLHVRQTVTVVQGAAHVDPPKSKRSRRAVPVPAQVIGALREHPVRQNERRLATGPIWRDHDLVFPTSLGTPINPNNLTRDYNRWVAQAGVPRIRIHDQRHTHVTLALQAGANIKAVSQRVGHAKTSITMDLYAHVLPEQHRDVSDKVCAALFGAGERAVTNS
jgi:integrase